MFCIFLRICYQVFCIFEVMFSIIKNFKTCLEWSLGYWGFDPPVCVFGPC